MTNLKDSQRHMLKEYVELLNVMEEGLAYLEHNLKEEAPPQVVRVFEDLLSAFDQLNNCHQQMAEIFEENKTRLGELIEDCKDIIQSFAEWFDFQTNDEKRLLIKARVLPQFESWKSQMDKFLTPYIVH
ncbi:hypothetical protein [Sediminibacillus massiliensis]|uniref:hypothetical protein n=1 Tax=Sediminibacillus massiliensis TaxID=1926277 RepID=UPI0009887314|nr:hypothetical protein [Sediminibacillus massiliensis]